MDWQNLPTIEANRIRLRWVSEADIDALYTIFSDPEVMRYWSSPPIADRDAAAKIVAEIHEGFASRAHLKWGLARLTDDMVIGTVTLYGLNLEHRRAEIGYAMGRAHWGNGYMQEALQALLGFAFDVLHLHRIEADVDPRNAASIRSLEKLGFQREGYLRERWQVGGEIQDALFYGLLRSDWEGRNQAG
ncbi:MAG TPA: GNAT family N-acetyltransferase [Pyrinomonadaceae bacterium]|nr:GNAT family N-acetyltransferase [Pyrinomonadaceae bacterium]